MKRKRVRTQGKGKKKALFNEINIFKIFKNRKYRNKKNLSFKLNFNLSSNNLAFCAY
jgi:hypothetical protein